MSPSAVGKSNHSESITARLLGSGTSGALELFIFHPVDTVAKRLMSNQTNIFAVGKPMSTAMNDLSAVIFRQYTVAPPLQRYISLFPGFGFAAGYKILQRIYKFGGQPHVNDYLRSNHAKTFTKLFGERIGKMITHATAGSIIGIGEVFLLPLDVLKIKKQTNPDAIRGRGMVRIIREEGLRGLYRGAGWTAARNAPGSFALFGGSALVKDCIFGLKDYNQATFFQNFCSSIGGAVASITVAAPLDVVKTRIQNRDFGDPRSGWKIIKDLIRKEGVHAFFKGLTPKILVVGPKLIFGFTVAQQLIPWFGKMVDGKKEEIRV